MQIAQINVVSGYFQSCHEGHKKYLLDASKDCDMLVVIVQSDNQQKRKYGEKAKSCFEISQEIRDWLVSQKIKCRISFVSNEDQSVANVLYDLAKVYKGNMLTFIKDGDRDYDSLPINEKEVIDKYYTFKFLGNPKVASSTEILNGEKQDA